MRYTEQEFKFDHIFDVIRYVFSSLILAPFRLINELTRKIIYIPLKVIERCGLVALGINVLIIVWTVIDLIRKNNFSLISGRMPLLPCMLSCVFLCVFQYSLTFVKNPKFNYVSEEEKGLEDLESDEEVKDIVLNDEQILKDDTLAQIRQQDSTALDEKLKSIANVDEEMEAYNNATPKELDDVIKSTLLEDDIPLATAMHIGVPEGKNAYEVVQEVAAAVTNDEFDLGDGELNISEIEMLNKASIIDTSVLDDINLDIDYSKLK